jgi:photosystem II stability/assembly factor-like uncharacterized protein
LRNINYTSCSDHKQTQSYNLIIKKIILSLFIANCSLISVYSQSGWVEQTNFPNFSLSSVYFINEYTGWAAGVRISNGGIVKTTNGGINWFSQYYGYNFNYIFSIFFINSNVGWACGNTDSSIILKTSNGGSNWHNLPDYPASSTYYSIKFLDQNTGWVVGYTLNQNGVIRKTTNGGINWYAQYTGGSPLYAIFLLNQSVIWVCGDYGTILNTTNGGTSWLDKYPGIDPALESIYFTNSNTGWAVGDVNPSGGTILKTTNGGINWFIQNSGFFSEFWSVFFTDQNTGWIAGGAGYPDTGIIIKTVNGGTNWFCQYTGPNYGMTSMYFVNQNTGWAVDVGGNIFKTTNGGNPIGIKPISNEIPKEFNLYQNYPNPFNPSSKIKFQIPKLGEVQLKIYDILGREVATLVNERLSPGTYEVEWDATNYPSGVFFYKLATAEFAESKRMVLIK